MSKSILIASLIPVIALVAMTAASADEPAQECNIRETARSFVLWTDDGLRLSINRSNGQIESVGLGGQESKIVPRPLFRYEEVLEISGSPNLLKDVTPSAWGVSAEVIDEGSGGWLRVRGNDSKKPRQVVMLDQTEAEPLVLSGQCRYEVKSEAAGWMNSRLALNIKGTYADGSNTPEESAYFGQYNHGAEFNQRFLCPDKPLKRVEVALGADDPKGTAWFRDVTLKKARYLIGSPNGECVRFDSHISQDFAVKAPALKGVVTYQPSSDYIAVRCAFRSEEKADRAISAYLAIPFDAVGGTWHDDVRRSRTIEAGHIYRSTDRWYGAGRDGFDSRYPFACVENKDGVGLAIATELSEPRVFQTEYDAVKRELRIRYDFGLSPDAGKWANRASFTAYIFTYDGRDGFRGAADKFQRMFDWAFAKRVKDEGLWIPFVTPECIPGGSDDFHIRFVEAQCNMGWEQAQGMYSLKYVEPWINHQIDQDFLPLKEPNGPIDPMACLKTAEYLRDLRGPAVPEDIYRRSAGYLGSYITDNWGYPQGYFFRQPGRKENMMIVNPNPDLPAPEGSNYSSGGFDMEIIREAAQVSRQWHIDGWSLRRSSEIPFAEVDTSEKASGKQSLRLDTVRSKFWTELYARGIDQVFYYKGKSAGPFELSYSIRGENIPRSGTAMLWNVEFWYQDGTKESFPVTLEGVTKQWKRFAHTFKTKAKPIAISVGFGKSHVSIDTTTMWIDDVRLTAQGDSGNLVKNGDFEQAELMPCRMGGVYMDTMECYLNNLNYRREQWPYADEPLTFDSARKPALQQQFSHITFARKAAAWARMRNMVVFANCSPVTCFGAPYLDAMGGEEFWMSGGKWIPKSDAEFNFVRFMCGGKPWNILQYSDLDADHYERYVKRCLFYGVYPSKTYGWSDPVWVAKVRPIYAKYMPILTRINKAGWQPLTLASSNNPDVWLERFGSGDAFYLTVFNPTAKTQSAKITFDSRARATRKSELAEIVEGTPVDMDGSHSSFEVTVGPEDLKVFRTQRSPV